MFCHFVARGNRPDVSLMVAGYHRDKDMAENLMKQRNIAARIDELREVYLEKFGAHALRDGKAGTRITEENY